MGEMKIKISDDVEKTFRKLAMQRFGYGRGAISSAAQKAMEDWTTEQSFSNAIDFEKFRGILKGVKKTSVELQHEAWNSVHKKQNNRR
jgi:hypothetical protein